jgi:hypothetical protein
MVVVITTCIILFCFCVSTVMLDRQIVVNGCSDHKVYNSLLFLWWLWKHKNKRELYTLWSLQPLTTICRSNMNVETQKQKRIIHFVITTTIDHYLSIKHDSWNTKTKENYTRCDHYNHWKLSVDLAWLLKHKNKRELYTIILFCFLCFNSHVRSTDSDQWL